METNATQTVSCFKCRGTGTLRHLMHIDNGVCFECDGAGVIEVEPVSARPATKRTAVELRERCILDLHAFIKNARAGRSTEWDEDSFAAIRGLLSVSPEDVRARALTAFAAAGVSL